MARPLRIQYPGAVYHITARGNERRTIFFSDKDRYLFLRTLAETVCEFRVICHAWVLMGNHYHLLLETPEPNLSRAIRYLNGVYAQKLNFRRTRVGHLFQGRFSAILVEKSRHLLELCRYIVLNPVRAGLREFPGQWKWSSYRSTAGIDRPEEWTTTDWVLGQFGKTAPAAQKAYRTFVRAGIGDKKNPWEGLKGQIYFGSEDFRSKLSGLVRHQNLENPSPQRHPDRPDVSKILEWVGRHYAVSDTEILERHSRAKNEPRDIAMFLLRHRAGMDLKSIAKKFGVNDKAVSRRVWIVKRRLQADQKFSVDLPIDGRDTAPKI